MPKRRHQCERGGQVYELGLCDEMNEGNLNFPGQLLPSSIALAFYHFAICLACDIMSRV
jgi:hypothetical protein